MIRVLSEEEGKKTYQITEDGKEILMVEMVRLRQQCENGERILGDK